jgi:hypothetical protein
MEFDAEELKEFIKSVIESVKSSIESQGYGFASPIEFELAVVKTKNKNVGFNIRVVDASSKHVERGKKIIN